MSRGWILIIIHFETFFSFSPSSSFLLLHIRKPQASFSQTGISLTLTFEEQYIRVYNLLWIKEKMLKRAFEFEYKVCGGESKMLNPIFEIQIQI